MEMKLSEPRKIEYDRFIKTAQEMEMSIGNMEYRKSRILAARAEIDSEIKKWWDAMIEELKLDKSQDYMITADGTLKDVPKDPRRTIINPINAPANVVPAKPLESKPVPASFVGTNAADLI